MAKILTKKMHEELVQSWQVKLDAANQKIAKLNSIIRQIEHEYQEKIIKMEQEIKEALEVANGAKLSVKRARDDARNSKERANRFKNKMERLEKELTAFKLDTLKSQK